MGIKKTLASLVLAGTMALGVGSKANAEIIDFGTDWGLPTYETGLIDGKYGWQSGDNLDNRGWEVIDKYSGYKALTFKPISNFNAISREDNYLTLHAHIDQQIEMFSIGGQLTINRNGFVEVYVSGDNSSWYKAAAYDSDGQDKRDFAWVRGWFNESWFSFLNITNDIYIKHSAGAISNQNYSVELWRVDLDVDVVPEPSTLGLLFLGGLVGALTKKKREKSR